MPAVGTRIRVLVDRAYGAAVLAGDTGLIVTADGGTEFGVRMDVRRAGSRVERRSSVSVGDSSDWWLRREHFEVIGAAQSDPTLASSRLRFVASRDGYSAYARPDGTPVFIADGYPLRYLVEFDIEWARGEWERVRYERYSWRFLDDLRERITEPDIVDDLNFCESCSTLHYADDMTGVSGDEYACRRCLRDNYRECNDCDEYVTNWTHTLDDDLICEGCAEGYSYCDSCEGYYHGDNAESHEHSEGCDCESPAMSFSVRNDGQPMLANDERVTVTLPSGILDDEGMTSIRRYLRNHVPPGDNGDDGWAVASLVDVIGRQWQTREGNFTKRLSRAAYKRCGVKLSPEVISQVGCIASDHSRQVDFEIEVTRDLNMSASDFFHEDSCWWQSYSSSRCALKANGGWGIRTFSSPYGYEAVSGRVWVMPLRKDERGRLVATFNSETPDAFVVFNGYGDLEGFNAARIVAHMAGMTYRKINFYASPMFVNGESGYLVAPEDIAAVYTDSTLSLSDNVEPHSDLYHRERREAALAAITKDEELVDA